MTKDYPDLTECFDALPTGAILHHKEHYDELAVVIDYLKSCGVTGYAALQRKSTASVSENKPLSEQMSNYEMIFIGLDTASEWYVLSKGDPKMCDILIDT